MAKKWEKERNFEEEESYTLEKSTENVSSGCRMKAPLSYNQLNCSAWPFLNTRKVHKVLGDNTKRGS